MENLRRFPRELVCPGGNPLSGHEFLVYCAYDHSHRILNHRYSAHLQKCRVSYELRKANAGEKPSWTNCRYNVEHKMYKPELLYHEHSCTDKKLPWLNGLCVPNIRLCQEMLHFNRETEQATLKSVDINDKVKSVELVNAGNQLKETDTRDFSFEDSDARNAKTVEGLAKDSINSVIYDLKVSPSKLATLTNQRMSCVKDFSSSAIVNDALRPDSKIAAISFKMSTMFSQNEELAISKVLDPDSVGYKRRPERRHRRLILSLFKQNQPPPIFEEVEDSQDADN